MLKGMRRTGVNLKLRVIAFFSALALLLSVCFVFFLDRIGVLDDDEFISQMPCDSGVSTLNHYETHNDTRKYLITFDGAVCFTKDKKDGYTEGCGYRLITHKNDQGFGRLRKTKESEGVCSNILADRIDFLKEIGVVSCDIPVQDHRIQARVICALVTLADQRFCIIEGIHSETRFFGLAIPIQYVAFDHTPDYCLGALKFLEQSGEK